MFRRDGALRHWPLLVPTTVWVLLFAGFLRSDVLHAVLAVTCIGLMFYQWRAYRSSDTGVRLVFWRLVVSGLALASLWLGLNVIRVYTYDGGESGRVYGFVVRVQDRLVEVTLALLAILIAWVMFDLARWTINKCRHLMGGFSS